MYVWHARLDSRWGDISRDCGLFIKKSDAKQSCQDDEKDSRLVWDNSDSNRAFAQSSTFSDAIFTVTRRPVRLCTN